MYHWDQCWKRIRLLIFDISNSLREKRDGQDWTGFKAFVYWNEDRASRKVEFLCHRHDLGILGKWVVDCSNTQNEERIPVTLFRLYRNLRSWKASGRRLTSKLDSLIWLLPAVLELSNLGRLSSDQLPSTPLGSTRNSGLLPDSFQLAPSSMSELEERQRPVTILSVLGQTNCLNRNPFWKIQDSRFRPVAKSSIQGKTAVPLTTIVQTMW